jgi:outer membrane usher protein
MRAFLCALLCTVFLLSTLAPSGAEEQRAVLTLRVNTVSKQDATVTLRGDDVLVPRVDLEQAGLKGFPFNGTGRPDDLISLSSLKPGLTYHVDDVALSLDITVTPEHLGGTVVDFGPHQEIAINKPAKSAFLNYSVSTSNQTGAAVAGEFGTRVGAGMFSSTFSASGNRQYNSNITSWTFDSPQSDQRTTIGDVVTTTGDLGGTVAIAGYGVERYFGLNPDIIKTALPQITGNTLTPSTADVYVNGVLYRHEILPPGQFNFQNLPIGQGPNNTTVVVTDAFGRQQTYSNYFYGADTMLARGLSDFSYGVGILHSEFGEQTGHGPAGAARYDFGATNNLTAGGRFEMSGNTISGGPTIALRLPGGILGVEAAASRSAGESGDAAVLSYQHMDPHVSAGLSATLESPRYSSLMLQPSQDRPLVNVQLSVSRQLSNRAGLTLSYYRQQDRDNGLQGMWQLAHTLQLSQTMQLQVSESLTNGLGQKTFGVQTALNFIPPHGLAASMNATETGGHAQATLQVQRPLDAQTPSFGYTASVTGGQDGGVATFASADYRGQYGNYSVDLGSSGGLTSTAVNVAGGVVFIDGHIFPTQSVADSYALVDTGGLSGVHVTSNNIVVGRTNAHGYLLVPQLGSYMNNEIALQSSDLPMNYTVDEPMQTVAPAYRSGDVVRFGISQVRPVTGNLLVRIGTTTVIPAYGVLLLDAGAAAQRSDIGEGGEFYFDKLAAGPHRAQIEFNGGQCTFDLTVPNNVQSFIKLGTVICQNGVRS